MSRFALLTLVFFNFAALVPQTQAFSSSRPATAWVSKPDGSIQCQGGGNALEEGAKELQKAGIKVIRSQKSSDGLMRAQVCGIPSGSLNTYEIDSKDLQRAFALGFTESSAKAP